MNGLNRLPAHELARLIREGSTTPSAVMAAHLARIEAREGVIGAFQFLDAERAMERAGAADRLPARGPLHGVPFVIKDIIDTHDMPTGWGFEAYREHYPGRTAACVQAFLDAGAIPVGKTVTTEFAYFRPGKTANPHNPDHTPGGSSSGSAAAVSDFMAPLAFGSQTAGSLIRPAAYCGVAAFKPTFGSFDLSGVMELSSSLDTLGIMARDPYDLMLARAVLTGTEPPNPPEFGEALPRVGLMRGPHWQEGDIEMRDTCLRALECLADTGTETLEIAHPPLFSKLTSAQETVMAYEAAGARSDEFDSYGDKISPQFAALIEVGRAVDEAAVSEALETRDSANAMFDQLFRDVDALLVPSAAGAAPEGLDATGDPLFSRMWNLLGVPCVAIPAGQSGDGLPLGIQLIAPRFSDARLLDVADFTHRALGN